MPKLTGIYIHSETGATWTVVGRGLVGTELRSSKGSIIKRGEEYENIFNDKVWIHLDFNVYYDGVYK